LVTTVSLSGAHLHDFTYVERLIRNLKVSLLNTHTTQSTVNILLSSDTRHNDTISVVLNHVVRDVSPRGQSGIKIKILASKPWPQPWSWLQSFGLGLASSKFLQK